MSDRDAGDVSFESWVRDFGAVVDAVGLDRFSVRDAAVPLEEGRLLAQMIPRARFLQLNSPNHFLLREEPARAVLVEALEAFLPP